MGFFVRYRRHAYKFFFVNNMASWHFACLPHYNQAWIEETGPLATAEEAALADFASTAKDFSYGSDWVGRPFVGAEDEQGGWEGVLPLLGPERTETMKRAFDTLEPRFRKVWQGDEPRLQVFAERLGEVLHPGKMERAVAAAEQLYGVAFPDLEILLGPSRGRSISGGANEGPGRITVAALESDDIHSVAEVVLHEAIHLLEQGGGFRDMYQEVSHAYGLENMKGQGYWDAHHLVREAIVGALVPGGALAPFLGGTVRNFAAEAEKKRAAGQNDNADLLALTGLCVPLMQEYVGAGRAVDRELVERVIRMLPASP